MDITMHHELIGKLLYIANRTHAATYFVIPYLSQFYHKRSQISFFFDKMLLGTSKFQREIFFTTNLII